MLGSRLKTVNQTIFIKIVIILILVGLTVFNVQAILSNISKSGNVDETIVSEANPRLNKKLIQSAIETLESFASGELTSFSPSDTVEQESTISEVVEQSTVAIQNASGIDGAASEFAEKLALKGYQISAISTAPSLQGQSTVIYKPGKAEIAQQVDALLRENNWLVGTSQQGSLDQQFDVLIVLGK